VDKSCPTKDKGCCPTKDKGCTIPDTWWHSFSWGSTPKNRFLADSSKNYPQTMKVATFPTVSRPCSNPDIYQLWVHSHRTEEKDYYPTEDKRCTIEDKSCPTEDKACCPTEDKGWHWVSHTHQKPPTNPKRIPDQHHYQTHPTNLGWNPDRSWLWARLLK
jgi:hypothetical protein